MIPSEIVSAFLKAQGVSRESLYQSFESYFSEQTIWENIGLSRSRGMAEAKQVVEKAEQMGIETIDVEILYQVQNENVVVNERIDHLLGKNGRELIALRVMGIFEVADGKIVNWRDYCDTASLRRQN
jgi:limonene-1,2-epoxide hydrolase